VSENALSQIVLMEKKFNQMVPVKSAKTSQLSVRTKDLVKCQNASSTNLSKSMELVKDVIHTPKLAMIESAANNQLAHPDKSFRLLALAATADPTKPQMI